MASRVATRNAYSARASAASATPETTKGKKRARHSSPAHAPPSANAAGVTKDSSPCFACVCACDSLPDFFSERVSNASRASVSNEAATPASPNADARPAEGGKRASSPRQYIARRDRPLRGVARAFIFDAFVAFCVASDSSSRTSDAAHSATALPPADAHAAAAHSATATAPASKLETLARSTSAVSAVSVCVSSKRSAVTSAWPHFVTREATGEPRAAKNARSAFRSERGASPTPFPEPARSRRRSGPRKLPPKSADAEAPLTSASAAGRTADRAARADSGSDSARRSAAEARNSAVAAAAGSASAAQAAALVTTSATSASERYSDVSERRSTSAPSASSEACRVARSAWRRKGVSLSAARGADAATARGLALGDAKIAARAFAAPTRVASLLSRSTRPSTAVETDSRSRKTPRRAHAAPAQRVAAAFTSASRSAAPTPSAAAATRFVAARVKNAPSSTEASGDPIAAANAGTSASHAISASAAVL